MNTHLLVEISIVFLEALLFYIFIHAKLSHIRVNCKNNIYQFIYLVGYVVIIYSCNLANVSTMVTIMLSLIMDTVFIKLFFSQSLFYSLFLGAMYSSICMIAEYITLMIPQVITKTPVEQMLAGGNLRTPISFSYIALVAVLVFLFAHLFKQNMYLSLLQKISYVLLSISGIAISHYILILTLTFAQNDAFQSKLNHLIWINMFFLIMLLSLLVYIYQLGKSKEQNIQYLKKEKQYELEEQEYRLLLNTTSSLRTMKHDIKQHLSVISTLAEQNELQKLCEYINSYFQELEKTNILLTTGNTAIDCLVSSKLSYAKELNIPIQYSVIIPAVFPMDDISLSSVIGNLLDNAIESSLRSTKNDVHFLPWIKFYIKPFQDMVVLHVENNFDGIFKMDTNSNYLSLKSGNDHGIGLSRVTELITENNGLMTVSTENHIFSVHIILPQKENLCDDN